MKTSKCSLAVFACLVALSWAVNNADVQAQVPDCIDYSDFLHWVGSVDTPGSSADVVISGSLAYVAHSGAGLQVIDISNPASPQILGSVDTPGGAYGAAISGSLAYVAGGDAGLQILPTQCDDTVGVDEDYLVPEPTDTPQAIADLSVHPNPFNPQATISYDLPKQTHVSLRIFDLAGRLVDILVDGETMPTGTHTATWTGRDSQGRAMPSGTYFYRLEAGVYTETKRMTLIR